MIPAHMGRKSILAIGLALGIVGPSAVGTYSSGIRTEQGADLWGESVDDVQLRLTVSDGPSAAGELPPFQVQLRNRGPMPVTFIGEALLQAQVEIDDIWYAQVSAGSCCTAPMTIAPGGKSEVLAFRVLKNWTFALNVRPARALALTPGRHSIRVRTASRDMVYVRSAKSDALVLTSNLASFELQDRSAAHPSESTRPPECKAGAGRRSDKIHGAVERGNRFTQRMAGTWIVGLTPFESGWLLEISVVGRENDDLSRLTPPWHGPNAREIAGWHFRNADNTAPNDGTVNAHGTLREFIFSPVVGRGLDLGGATTAADVERVRAFGRGWLFIDSYNLTPARKGDRASIEAMTFWACATWPAD